MYIEKKDRGLWKEIYILYTSIQTGDITLKCHDMRDQKRCNYFLHFCYLGRKIKNESGLKKKKHSGISDVSWNMWGGGGFSPC